MATYNLNTDRRDLMPEHDRGKFYMLPKEIGQLYALLPKFDVYCEKVYAVLLDRANEYGEAWPSVYTLAKETGFGTSTIKRKLPIIAEYGLIEVNPRVDGRGNMYRVYQPLSYAQFLREFPHAVEEFAERERKVNEQREKDTVRRRQK